jgi:hypothetical protein
MRLKTGILLLIAVAAVAALAVALGRAGLQVTLGRQPTVQEIAHAWSRSSHADGSAPAFTHWDQEQPPLIPPTCAKCHSLYGFYDFLGLDGTPAGSVENAARTGSVIDCNACHNDAVAQLTSVVFPSGAKVDGLGPEAVCMECHQGITAPAELDKATAGIADDTVGPKLTFINVHYRLAAATQYGNEARVAYQYPGKSYVGVYRHVKGMSTCVQCHDPHGLGVNAQSCSPCHSNVVTGKDLPNIRKSSVDYTGNGSKTEGMGVQAQTFLDALYKAIQIYAANVAGKPIVYSDNAYPYFFVDTNGDGVANPDETMPSNAYNAWTPRLLRAAYNYQFVRKDPGAYAHNSRYVLQIMYDSIADLASKAPIDLDGLIRPAQQASY